MAHLDPSQLAPLDLPSHRLRPQRLLARLVADAKPHWHSDWAWQGYEDAVRGLIREHGLTRVCEIGGGRDPYLTPELAAALGAEVTVNDIDAAELALTPKGLATACFDIAGDPESFPIGEGSFDLMVARMVFEHVPDVARAWANVHHLLSPGGVGLAFFPTLYALPFLVNHLLPERVSSRLLSTLSKDRSAEGADPKFPARYDWCFGDERRLAPMLRSAGFEEFAVIPFWGYGYLRRVPVAREIDHAINRLAAAAGWKATTSYALVLVRKSPA